MQSIRGPITVIGIWEQEWGTVQWRVGGLDRELEKSIKAAPKGCSRWKQSVFTLIAGVRKGVVFVVVLARKLGFVFWDLHTELLGWIVRVDGRVYVGSIRFEWRSLKELAEKDRQEQCTDYGRHPGCVAW